jgi:hypothetical protein
MSVDDHLNLAPEIRPLIMEIRRQKEAGEGLRPSVALIDRSQMLTAESRMSLLDKIADLVDENYAGRSEMCQQFAELLHRALAYMHFPSRTVAGTAIYYNEKRDDVFRWNHAWVRVGDEVIDGNADVLAENPLVPEQVRARPYWGPITEVPEDRRLREDRGAAVPSDVDVDATWWPELRAWIDAELLGLGVQSA